MGKKQKSCCGPGPGSKDISKKKTIQSPQDQSSEYSADVDASNQGGPASWSDSLRRAAGGNKGMPAKGTASEIDVEYEGFGTSDAQGRKL